MPERSQEAAFGGGCHWCTEAVFAALPGVTRVDQGFAGGPPPHDALSEAARVRWSDDTNLAALVAVHLDTHAAQSDHKLRARYRSAIYVTGEAQAEEAARLLAEEADRRGPLVTRVLPLTRWEDSPERYRGYYARRPDAPFCRTHIAPKLDRLDAQGRLRSRHAAPVRKEDRTV